MSIQKVDTAVGNLVDMIERGELRLPEMQRRYVWTGTRVRDLLDSLYRGYPSGKILVHSAPTARGPWIGRGPVNKTRGR